MSIISCLEVIAMYSDDLHYLSIKNIRQITQMACDPPHPGVQNNAGAPQDARTGDSFPGMVHSQT